MHKVLYSGLDHTNNKIGDKNEQFNVTSMTLCVNDQASAHNNLLCLNIFYIFITFVMNHNGKFQHYKNISLNVHGTVCSTERGKADRPWSREIKRLKLT